MDELDLTSAESKATYQEIQEWVQEKYGFHVSHLNIAKTKRKCGIIERKNYNLPKSEDSRSPETLKREGRCHYGGLPAFSNDLNKKRFFRKIPLRNVLLVTQRHVVGYMAKGGEGYVKIHDGRTC